MAARSATPECDQIPAPPLRPGLRRFDLAARAERRDPKPGQPPPVPPRVLMNRMLVEPEGLAHRRPLPLDRFFRAVRFSHLAVFARPEDPFLQKRGSSVHAVTGVTTSVLRPSTKPSSTKVRRSVFPFASIRSVCPSTIVRRISSQRVTRQERGDAGSAR
jgi:hypothetical protein